MLTPMLAKSYAAESYRVRWPWYVQPKLNGVRCIATLERGEVRLFSRNGRLFAGLDDVRASLQPLLREGVPLDGELYLHGLALQEITSRVKRGGEGLNFHCYDVALKDVPFCDRLDLLPRYYGFVCPVPTVLVSSEEAFWREHALSIGMGYEGTILRRPASLYAFGERSADLLKHKDWQEEEFTIVGGRAATGEQEGAVVFECETAHGKRFGCVPRFPLDDRREIYQNLGAYVGQRLTVRYLERSLEGIPTGCPVGVAVRNYE